MSLPNTPATHALFDLLIALDRKYAIVAPPTNVPQPTKKARADQQSAQAA